MHFRELPAIYNIQVIKLGCMEIQTGSPWLLVLAWLSPWTKWIKHQTKRSAVVIRAAPFIKHTDTLTMLTVWWAYSWVIDGTTPPLPFPAFCVPIWHIPDARCMPTWTPTTHAVLVLHIAMYTYPSVWPLRLCQWHQSHLLPKSLVHPRCFCSAVGHYLINLTFH